MCWFLKEWANTLAIYNFVFFPLISLLLHTCSSLLLHLSCVLPSFVFFVLPRPPFLLFSFPISLSSLPLFISIPFFRSIHFVYQCFLTLFLRRRKILINTIPSTRIIWNASSFYQLSILLDTSLNLYDKLTEEDDSIQDRNELYRGRVYCYAVTRSASRI